MQFQSLRGGNGSHPSVPAWEIPWTGEPGRLQSIGLQESETTEATWHTWTVGGQAPLSKGFPRQEHWVGCHFFLQDLPNPEFKPASPALEGDSLPLTTRQALLDSIAKMRKAELKTKKEKNRSLPKSWGFPDGTAGKESACQCRRHKRHRFDPWVWKIP